MRNHAMKFFVNLTMLDSGARSGEFYDFDDPSQSKKKNELML